MFDSVKSKTKFVCSIFEYKYNVTMNKKTILSTLAASLLLVGVVSFSLFSPEKTYSPRTAEVQSASGYSQYLTKLRADKATGEVNPADVAAVRADIAQQSGNKFKANWPLQWEFKGPDNIGGRTRCLVIDKDNTQILYTGGVSGSLFKSVNGGTSWYPLTLGDDNFGVVSMAQTSDGHIYYGTGENGQLLGPQSGSESSGFEGMGMFKSTDGETFSLVSTSNTFGNIHALTSHPTENWVFCGSSNGLRMSKDAGATWTLLRPGSCRDIKFNKNGVAMAYIGSLLWRSANPSVGTSFEPITENIATNRRSVVAWSESDPNYCYVVSTGNVTFDGESYGSALTGLYRSKDAGATFERLVGQMSRFFHPFSIIDLQAQGLYNMALGVHPRDKNRVFIGGIEFAEWTEEAGARIVGNKFRSPQNRFGIHSDKHFITFDNTGKDPIMYICNDGGIARTTNADLDNYIDISTNFITTQFFGIAASKSGVIMGGTQDNNTMIISGQSFPRKKAVDVIGGDGFQCAISLYDPNFMFGESQYGNLRRSITGGGAFSSIWDNRIRNSFVSANRPTSSFNTAITLWENPQILAELESRDKTPEDDSLIDARLYYGADDGVWMVKNALSKAHDPANPKNNGAIRWFRVADISSQIHYMKPTADGQSLFVCTDNGRIYRIDSLLTAQFDSTSLVSRNAIAPKLKLKQINQGFSLGGRTVTSVAIDKADPNRVVMTAGNYSGTTFVYITEDALSDNPSWRSIQGNLPRFPVYHAVISENDPDVIILGTEFGIWATSNGSATNPTWAEAIEGVDADMPMPRVPVFDLIQVAANSSTGATVYAGTHGMGIWASKSLLTNVPQADRDSEKEVSISAYPNPANLFVNLDTKIMGAYTLTVYNLSGQTVRTVSGTNSGLIKLNTTDLVTGNYFVEILGKNQKAVTKIIVQH
jgi:hypothetical protein